MNRDLLFVINRLMHKWFSEKYWLWCLFPPDLIPNQGIHSKLATSSWGKNQILHSFQHILHIFWGWGEPFACVASGLDMWLHSQILILQLKALCSSREMKLPESIPFLCLLSRVCTSSLLRMDELGEEKIPAKSLVLLALPLSAFFFWRLSASSHSFP